MLATLVLCLVFVMVVSAQASVVVTSTGPVRGKLNHEYDTFYYSYEGIPYAENPTGKLRFQAPVPKSPWTEIFDATKQGYVCPQTEGKYNKSQMSEDCLLVNVYVPVVPADITQHLPVYVFCHGGGFKMLSGNIDQLYGPQFFLQQNIIFVAMNYRLGALGYLSLETKDAPGNAGLRDIILALKWIRTNIARFGGDKTKVTFGGNSSGSAAIQYLLLTQPPGLFHQAILSSGSALNFRFIDKQPRQTALELAKVLGFKTKHLNLLLQNLTTVDAFSIVEAQEEIYKKTRSEMRPFNAFVPNVEPESPDAVITRTPLEITKSGIPHNIPVLLGFNSLEGIYQWATIKKNKNLTRNLQNKISDCIPPNIEYPKNSIPYRNLVDSISDFYFNEKLSNFSVHNFLELISDTQYSFVMDYWLRLIRNTNMKCDTEPPLYYYVFDFDGALNWAKLTYNVTDVPGTAHSDDVGYLFVTKETRPLLDHVNERSLRMKNILLTYYTNFIKYGNPTPTTYRGVKWPQYCNDMNYMLISENPSKKTDGPYAHRFSFWYNAYSEYDKYVDAGGEVANNNYI